MRCRIPTSDMRVEPIVHRLGSGPLHVPIADADTGTRWRLLEGDRSAGEGRLGEGRAHLSEALPAGLYRLDVLGDDDTVRSSRPVLVVPPTAFQGEFDRVWVLAVQLYSVRSQRNWGIGDFTDLKDLLGLASRLGCAGIGLNPLHALFEDQPADCSPYAPSSRLFLNPIYIDVEAVAEFTGLDAATRDAIAREKQEELIDYPAVSQWKLTALQLAFENFKVDRTSERFRQFDAFRRERGTLLRRFADFSSAAQALQAAVVGMA